MPYMQGPERLVGDPGFFSFLGKALGTVGRLVPGPIGAGVQAVGGLLAPPRRPTPLQMAQQQPGRTGQVQVQFPPFTPHPLVRIGGQRVQPAAPPGAPLMAGQRPAGHHLNKSDYFLRDGTFVPRGTRWVRNRTRNPANPRALRRAIGRAKAFDRLVKQNRKALRSLARI